MSKPLGPVVVIGDIQPDITFRLPRSGEKPDREVHGPVVGGGGTAANAAAALARLGVAVCFIGAVGNDPFGRLVVEELKGLGVDMTACVVSPTAPTPVVFALSPPDGETALYRWPRDEGADWSLTPAAIDESLIARAGWLHATGISLRYSPAREAVLRAMRLARKAGIAVSLDLNFRSEQRGDEPGLRAALGEALALATVILGHGEEEIMAYAGSAELDAAMQALARPNQVVVGRLGARGVRVFAGGSFQSHPAFPATVVSTVGAGDAFDGGFISASLAGLDLPAAIARGQAVAALKVSRGGARALPSLAEVESFLADLPGKRGP